MKVVKYICVILVMSLFVVAGCKEDDPEEEVVSHYLVDYELDNTALATTADFIKLGLASGDFSELADKVKYDIQIYTITYKTLFEGDSILVSGVVAVPIAESGSKSFPMMSYQHGTIVQKSQAPSLNIASDPVSYLASTGIVVVMADYVGFGASATYFHPFMHNQYTVNAVLDMIRASKEFISIEKPCSINDDLFMFGYSQGASATVGSLSAIENDNDNSDIQVTAAVAGGGAYDLTSLQKWIMQRDRYEQPYYIAYLLESFKTYVDSDIDYSLVFNEPYASNIPSLFDGVTDGATINKFGTNYSITYVDELFNDDFEDYTISSTDTAYASLWNAFEANKIDAWSITTPLYLYYGNNDIWIPGAQTIELYQEFQGLGTVSNVSLIPLDGLDHTSAIYPSVIAAMDLFLSY